MSDFRVVALGWVMSTAYPRDRDPEVAIHGLPEILISGRRSRKMQPFDPASSRRSISCSTAIPMLNYI